MASIYRTRSRCQQIAGITRITAKLSGKGETPAPHKAAFDGGTFAFLFEEWFTFAFEPSNMVNNLPQFYEAISESPARLARLHGTDRQLTMRNHFDSIKRIFRHAA
jgi:hypothetical protein